MKYFRLNLILKGGLTAYCLLMLPAMQLNAQREAKQIGDFKESISLNEHLRGANGRCNTILMEMSLFVSTVRTAIPVLCMVAIALFV